MTLPKDRSNNGGRTHPLTLYATGVLRLLDICPRPYQEINPGVIDRLTREPNPLAEIVQLPSPYKVHRGDTCKHLQITAAGRDVVRSLE